MTPYRNHITFDADIERRRHIWHEAVSWGTIGVFAFLLIGLGVMAGMNWDKLWSAWQ